MFCDAYLIILHAKCHHRRKSPYTLTQDYSTISGLLLHVRRNSAVIDCTYTNGKNFRFIFIAGLWAMISKTKSIPEDNRKSPLAIQSLLLLLVLSSHNKQEDENCNPFRHLLFRLGAEESGIYVLLIPILF